MAEKVAATYTPRLKKLYSDQIAGELKKELELSNIHQVPSLKKIVVASGVGRNKDNKHFQEVVANTLTRITGQKPVSRIAKKSIATFKIRKGMGAAVGQSVTLRGDRMYEFLDRLVSVAMPRIRDFHGVGAKAAPVQRVGGVGGGNCRVVHTIAPWIEHQCGVAIHRQGDGHPRAGTLARLAFEFVIRVAAEWAEKGR